MLFEFFFEMKSTTINEILMTSFRRLRIMKKITNKTTELLRTEARQCYFGSILYIFFI